MRLNGDQIARIALAVVACWAAGLSLIGSVDVLLFLAPALLIAVPLLAGRYIGENIIAGLVTKRIARRRRPRSASSAASPAPLVWSPRGTRLIAFSLAKRPPPAALPLTQS